MRFMQSIKSLDDLLYEVMSWLVFYPVTLWRTVRHPLTTMEYAAAQLEHCDAQQFPDSLHPPLFLLLSLLLSHAVELAYLGQNSLVANDHGLARYVTDDASLLLLRLAVFAVLPIVFATLVVRRQRRTLTRAALQAPLYGQCYVTGPFALALGLGAVLLQMHMPGLQPAGAAVILVALLWFVAVQARWFACKLQISIVRGVLLAAAGMIQWCLAILLLVPLLA